MRTGRNLEQGARAERPKSRSLGYAHWPELPYHLRALAAQSRSLGYAHWPEPRQTYRALGVESRSLGYAHWPELLAKASADAGAA